MRSGAGARARVDAALRLAHDVRDRAAAESSFVPVLVEAPVRGLVVGEPTKTRRPRSPDGGIELEIDRVVVRVSRGAEAKTVAVVIQALNGR